MLRIYNDIDVALYAQTKSGSSGLIKLQYSTAVM